MAEKECYQDRECRTNFSDNQPRKLEITSYVS